MEKSLMVYLRKQDWILSRFSMLEMNVREGLIYDEPGITKGQLGYKDGNIELYFLGEWDELSFEQDGEQLSMLGVEREFIMSMYYSGSYSKLFYKGKKDRVNNLLTDRKRFKNIRIFSAHVQIIFFGRSEGIVERLLLFLLYENNWLIRILYEYKEKKRINLKTKNKKLLSYQSIRSRKQNEI
jgi:hypothetical protein